MPNDPYRNFNFRVEIDGVAQAGFSEVLIGGGRADVVEYREGGDPTIRKLPGLVRFNNIVLMRGLTASRDLYEWWRTVVDGSVQRRNVVILLLDEQGAPVLRWKVRGAWPAAYSSSDLHAQGDAVVIETLELAHEGIEREDA